MDKSTLEKTLLGIDEEAYLALGVKDPLPKVVIVGGAAFMLRDLTQRSITHDIDLFSAERSVREIIMRYPQVNGAVAAYMDQIPYNFEDRLVKLTIGAKAIEYLTPSTEDLAVMKLYACRPNDVQDLESAARNGHIDWEVLEHLVYDEDEAKASVLSERRYREMAHSYELFKERCKR
jgi:hypothetical protein